MSNKTKKKGKKGKHTKNKKPYCGNNAISTELKSGARLGTRHLCLKRGYGIGYHTSLKILATYSRKYKPIDTRKFYCGNDKYLPDNYDLMGNLPICLSKGVGLGIAKRIAD